MEMAVRVAKWKSQLGDLHIKENEILFQIQPKLEELERIRADIKRHEGALSEAYAIQMILENKLREQGKLGGTRKKFANSVLDKAEKLESNVRPENSDNPRPWAKSGTVSL